MVALGAVAGGRSVSAVDISTLVGNYVTSTAGASVTLGAGPNAATSSALVTSALAHGNEAAHIIAELRTFTETGDDWNDMNTDYAADVHTKEKSGKESKHVNKVTGTRRDDVVAS